MGKSEKGGSGKKAKLSQLTTLNKPQGCKLSQSNTQKFTENQAQIPIIPPDSPTSESLTKTKPKAECPTNSQQEKPNLKKPSETLSCDDFPETMIQALIFMSTLSTYNKIYGHFIVDANFNILYADKLAKQFLEASLSPLSTNNFLDFVVKDDRLNFPLKCKTSIQTGNSFSYLIYSRSSLRKYNLKPQLETPSNWDYFFRYLKCLTSEVMPISIDLNLNSIQKSQDSIFWNKKLIKKGHMTKCYLFRTRYSAEIEDIERYNFEADEVLGKFMTLQNNKKIRMGVNIDYKISQMGWKFIPEVYKASNLLKQKQAKTKKIHKQRLLSAKKSLSRHNPKPKPKPTQTRYTKLQSQAPHPDSHPQPYQVAVKTQHIHQPRYFMQADQFSSQLCMSEQSEMSSSSGGGYEFSVSENPAIVRMRGASVRHDDQYIAQFII